MRKILSCVILLTAFQVCCNAQFYIEPVGGLQIDMNNKNIYLLNTAVRGVFKNSARNAFIIQVQKSWGLHNSRMDSSFTLNTSLPLYSAAERKLRVQYFSFGLGDRFLVAGFHRSNKFFFQFFSGVLYQKITPEYSYDKNNYTLLNPSFQKEGTSFFISGGLTFMHQLKNNALLVELNITSPPFLGNKAHTQQVGFVIPASLNIGYSFKLSKK